MSHRPHPPRRSSTTPSVASRNGNQVRVAGARRPSDVSSASIALSVSTVSSPSSSPMGVGSSSSQLPSQAQQQAMHQHQHQQYQYQMQHQHRRHGSSSNVAPAPNRRHSANVSASTSPTSATAAPLARSSTVSGRPRPTSRMFIGNAIPPAAEASDSIPRSAPASGVSVRPSFSLRRRTSQRTLGTPRPRPAQPPSALPPGPPGTATATSSARKNKSHSMPGVNPLANCLAFLLCRTTTDRSSTSADSAVAPPIPLPAMYMPATTHARAASRLSTGDPRRHSTAPSAMSALDTGVTATLTRDAGGAGVHAGESSTSHVRGRTMSDVGSSPEHSPEVIPDPDPVPRYHPGGGRSGATSPRSGASTPWSTVPAPRMPNRDTFSSALSSRSVDTDDDGGYLTTDEAMSEYDVDETETSVAVEASSMSFADESEVEPEPVLVRKSTPLLASAAAGANEDPAAASMSIQYRYRASSSSMSGVHSVGGGRAMGAGVGDQQTPASARSSTTVPTSVPSSYHVPAAPPPSTSTQAAQYTAGPGATSISYRHRPTPPAPPPSAASHPATSARAPHTQADPGAYSITHRTAAGTDVRVTVSPAKERAAFGNKWAGAWHPGWRSTRAFVHSVFDLVGCNREAVVRMYPLFRATRMTPQHFSVMTIYLARFLAAYRNTMPEAAGGGVVEAPGSPASASDDSRRSLDTVQLTRTRGALGSFKWKLGQAKKKLTRSASKSKLRSSEGEEEVDAAGPAASAGVAAAAAGVLANQSLDEQFAAAWAALATERLPFDRPTSVPSARAAAKSTGRSNIPPAERLVRAQVRLLTVATLLACKVLNDHSFTAKAVSGVAPEKCFTGCPDLVALEMRVAVLLEFDFAVRRAHLRPLLEAVIMGAGSSRAMAAQQQQQMQGSLRSVGSSANGGRPATFAEPSPAAETVEGAAEEAKATISVCRRLLRILDETMADLGEMDEVVDFAPPAQQPQQHQHHHQHVHYAMSPPGLSTRVDTMDSGHASVSSPQHSQHANGSSAAATTTSRRRNADSAVASTAHSATSSRRATPEARKSSVPPFAVQQPPITVNNFTAHHTPAVAPVPPTKSSTPSTRSGRRSRSRSRSRARSTTNQVPLSPPPFPPPNQGPPPPPQQRSRSGSVVSAQAMLASLIHAADDVTAAATTNGPVHHGYEQFPNGGGSLPRTPMPSHLGPQPAASTTPSTLYMVPSPANSGSGPHQQSLANGHQQPNSTDYFHQHMNQHQHQHQHQPQLQLQPQPQYANGYTSMPRILTPSIGHMSISSSGSSGTCHHAAYDSGNMSWARAPSTGGSSVAMQALASLISIADVSPTSLRGSLHSPRETGGFAGHGHGRRRSNTSGSGAGAGAGAGSSSSGLSPASTLRPATADADDSMSCSAVSSSVAPSMALSSTSEISSRPASANDAGVGPMASQGGGGGLRHMASLERVAGQMYASPIPHLRKSVSAANVLGPRKSKRSGAAAVAAASKWNVPTLPTTEDAAQALASSLETIAASPSTVMSFGSGHTSSIAPSSDMSSTNPLIIAHPRPRVRQQAPRVVAHRRSMPPGLQSLMSPRAAALQRAGLIQLGSNAAPAAINTRPSLEMTSFSAPVTPTSAVPPNSTARHPASVFSALPGSIHWPGSLASPSAASTPPHELASSRVSDTSTRSTFATAPTVLQPTDAEVWTSSDLMGGSQVSRRQDQRPAQQQEQGVSASSSPSSTKATIYATSLAN